MRTILSLVLLVGLSSSAFAIGELKKDWVAIYLGEDASAEFKTAGRKAGCAVCHMKKGDKKKAEGRNEYGKMMSKFLASKKVKIGDLKKEYKDPATKETAQKKIIHMFEEVCKQKAKDGKTFAERIKASMLPATDFDNS